VEEQKSYGGIDWLAGRELAAPLKGRAVGVDRDGALLVETLQGRKRVLAGTVLVEGEADAVGF
jgi:hypothetical protein